MAKSKKRAGNPNAKKGAKAINAGKKLSSRERLRQKSIDKARDLLKQRKQRRLRSKHRREVKKRLEKQKPTPTDDAVINEFFKCFNKRRAYQRVYGYDSPNPDENAHFIFSKENVKAEIARRFAEMKYTNEQTQIMLQDRAEASIEDFTRWDEELECLVYDEEKANASGKKHLIKKIHFFDFGGIKSIEINDPGSDLDKIAKIQQQYSDIPPLPPVGAERGKNALRKMLDRIHAKDNTNDSQRK